MRWKCIIHGMKQGLRTAASIALATTCAAAPKATPESAALADVHGIVAEMKTLVDGLDRRAEERNTELFEHIKAQERTGISPPL